MMCPSEQERRCTECRIILPISAFGKHKDGKGGIRGRCKHCEVRANAAHRRTERGAAALQRYRSTEAGIASAKSAYRKWIESDLGKATKRANDLLHLDHLKARQALDWAVRSGKVYKWPTCAVPECNSKPHAHHPDYSAPMSVVWLCPAHHKQAHALVKKAA